MAENSGISWTDHTFNPWIGCTNVSPACDHCYAENLATNRLGVGWGNDAPRRRTADANWAKVRRWNRGADAFKAEHGRYPRVFAASLADIFDNQVDPSWRADFWALVKETPKLQWLIVTKRIGNVTKMLPDDWGFGYPNVVLIITVANQTEFDRDVPKLLMTPARWRGLSIEPMLGPIDLRIIRTKDILYGTDDATTIYPLRGVYQKPGSHWSQDFPKIDWVITGGESRQLPGPRDLVPLEAHWVRDIDTMCVAAGVPHHFKQWGYTIPISQISDCWPHPVLQRDIIADTVIQTGQGLAMSQHARTIWREHTQRKDGSAACAAMVASHDMGRLLDGAERNGFPPTL